MSLSLKEHSDVSSLIPLNQKSIVSSNQHNAPAKKASNLQKTNVWAAGKGRKGPPFSKISVAILKAA